MRVYGSTVADWRSLIPMLDTAFDARCRYTIHGPTVSLSAVKTYITSPFLSQAAKAEEAFARATSSYAKFLAQGPEILRATDPKALDAAINASRLRKGAEANRAQALARERQQLHANYASSEALARSAAANRDRALNVSAQKMRVRSPTSFAIRK